LLLETHVWLWTLLQPARLSAGMRVLPASLNNRLRLSSISLRETLAERGRLALRPEPFG